MTNGIDDTAGRTVTDNASRSRYELTVDGEVVSYVEYVVDGDDITFTHTFTEPRRRENGFAAVLVQGALDDVRARSLKVHPNCWFVAEFIADHAAYQDLLAT